MAKAKTSRLLRDSGGRIFLNCVQMKDRKGYDEVIEPGEFETVGTVSGKTVDDFEDDEPETKAKPKAAKAKPKAAKADPEAEAGWE